MTRRLALIVLFVLVAGAGSATANGVSQSFVDPTVTIYGAADIHLGDEVFVGPFARLLAAGPTRSIHVGDESIVLGPGGLLQIPPNVIHWGEVVGDEPVLNLDIFTPVREEYAPAPQ